MLPYFSPFLWRSSRPSPPLLFFFLISSLHSVHTQYMCTCDADELRSDVNRVHHKTMCLLFASPFFSFLPFYFVSFFFLLFSIICHICNEQASEETSHEWASFFDIALTYCRTSFHHDTMVTTTTTYDEFVCNLIHIAGFQHATDNSRWIMILCVFVIFPSFARHFLGCFAMLCASLALGGSTRIRNHSHGWLKREHFTCVGKEIIRISIYTQTHTHTCCIHIPHNYVMSSMITKTVTRQ